RISQVTAQGSQGGLPEDRGGNRVPAPSAVEATEPRAEAPRADGGEASVRAGREGHRRPEARVVAGSPRRGSARGGAADRGNRPGFARRPALAAGREAPPHGARGAHQGGGRDNLAEDRAGVECITPQGSGQEDGGDEGREEVGNRRSDGHVLAPDNP